MELILQEDFPALGYVGDRVVVKRGYARNYLIPRGIAVELTSGRASAIKHVIEIVAAKKKKKKKEAEERLKDFLGLTLEFQLKGNESGKVFGAVTVRDVEVALQGKGLVVDRRQIRLVEAVRQAGSYEVSVKLHPDVVAIVKLAVSVEVAKKSEVSSDERESRRGRRRGNIVEDDSRDLEE